MTNFDDGRPYAELHPRWQATVLKSEIFGAQSELKVLTLQVSVFLAVWEGAPFCCNDHYINGHISPWCRV